MGNEVATFAQSWMRIGPLARSAATLNDGDTMITVGPDFTGTDHATLDDDAVGCRFRLDTQRLQPVGHDLDTIRLLDAQLLGTAQGGATLGACRGNEEHGKLVDGQRHGLRECRYP